MLNFYINWAGKTMSAERRKSSKGRNPTYGKPLARSVDETAFGAPLRSAPIQRSLSPIFP